MLDRWTNTGLSTLASGIDASQTTATLATGTGGRFPADTFNVVLWNSTDFANPIDASDREIVRCTTRSGDVLTIVRGQEGTTGVAHNTAGKTYSVALIVSQKFRDDLQTGHEIDGNPKFKSGTSFSGEFDHDNRANRVWKLPDIETAIMVAPPAYIFYEDFVGPTTALPATEADFEYTHSFWRTTAGGSQTMTSLNTAGGILRMTGSGGGSGGGINLRDGAAAALATPFLASKNPRIEIREASEGTEASNRRLGLAGTTWGSADPADGIYIRHTGTGNIIAVARAASTESTLDTGVAAADGVFHTTTLKVEGGNTVRVFVDGVEKGTITTNVPTVALSIGGSPGTNSAGQGWDLDYFYVIQDR